MADDQDLELGHGDLMGDNQQHSVSRKNIALKLKVSPSGKSKRGRKPKTGRTAEDRVDVYQGELSLDEIKKSLMKGPSEPVQKSRKLSWAHKVNLIGERVIDPLIHCCEKCDLPILIYGRLIPCKHVFCLECGKKTEKKCPRCDENVQRVESAALGTVFMCTHGGFKHGVSGCRRTYLSGRDLQAHIQYRHLRDQQKAAAAPVPGPVPGQVPGQVGQPAPTQAQFNQALTVVSGVPPRPTLLVDTRKPPPGQPLAAFSVPPPTMRPPLIQGPPVSIGLLRPPDQVHFHHPPPMSASRPPTQGQMPPSFALPPFSQGAPPHRQPPPSNMGGPPSASLPPGFQPPFTQTSRPPPQWNAPPPMRPQGNRPPPRF